MANPWPVLDNTDAPNGVLQATPLRVAKTTGEHFKITWQDANAVAFHTLGDDDVVVTFPDGSQHPARLISTEKNRNSGIITATYSVAPPAGGWTSSANGTYTVSVRANHVWDTTGHAADGRALGLFNVQIPACGGWCDFTRGRLSRMESREFLLAGAKVPAVRYSWIKRHRLPSRLEQSIRALNRVAPTQ